MAVLANFEPNEGTVTGSKVINLTLKSVKLMVTNDSSTEDLKYKFNDTESYGTLKPTESLSLYIRSRKVYLQGNGVPYRVWNYG